MPLAPWQRLKLNHLHPPASTTLAIDHLPALLRAHPRPKSDLAGPLHFAGFMRIVHRSISFCSGCRPGG